MIQRAAFSLVGYTMGPDDACSQKETVTRTPTQQRSAHTKRLRQSCGSGKKRLWRVHATGVEAHAHGAAAVGANSSCATAQQEILHTHGASRCSSDAHARSASLPCLPVEEDALTPRCSCQHAAPARMHACPRVEPSLLVTPALRKPRRWDKPAPYAYVPTVSYSTHCLPALCCLS